MHEKVLFHCSIFIGAGGGSAALDPESFVAFSQEVLSFDGYRINTVEFQNKPM